MENLINELQQPRHIAPSQAQLRAAKALQELIALKQADTQARLLAEQKLVEAYGEIQELRRQLNEKNNTSDPIAVPADVVGGNAKAEINRDEMPDG